MKPDMKIVRSILLGLERDGALLGRFPPAATEHCLLLWEAGLIEQGLPSEAAVRGSGMMGWRNATITPRGTCALNSLREEENLRLVQQHADALGAHATFAQLKIFLQQVANWGTPPASSGKGA
ncbi:MAG: hypothetical protein IT578_06145 [Verrucomicrobiae bacterium]|nr:hypothetical protein [Verrucomicrobiae bacterium]